MGEVIDTSQIEASLAERDRALSAEEEDLRKRRRQLTEDQRALQRVLALSGGGNSSLIEDVPSREAKTVKEAVREAILFVGRVNTTFSSNEIAEYLEGRARFDVEKNRSNISSYMNNDFVTEGVLEVVIPAAGRRPGFFQLTDVAKLLL